MLGSIYDHLLSSAKHHRLLIGILVFIFYGNSLVNEFAVDDGIVITRNEYVIKGISGIPDLLTKDTFRGFFKKEGKDKLVSGGRYRPLTPVFFAIVYEIFGAMPFVFHLFNLLAYLLLCLLLYKVLNRLFFHRFKDKTPILAFLSTLIYLAHPVHTECVTNVKGLDEIAALLFSLLCFNFILNYIETNKNKNLLFALLSLFLGLMSKENAITFILLIPAGLYLLYNQKFNVAIKYMCWLIIPGILFFLIRAQILGWNPIAGESGELMNNPFLKFVNNKYIYVSTAERYGTIFYTLLKYIGLLLFPHPLTYDYYPKQIAIQSIWNIIPLSSLAIYTTLIYAIIKFRNTRPHISYSILFYLLPLGLVCNIIFPIGTFMGERFLFMPSVGFSILMSFGFVTILQKNKSLGTGLLVLLILLYGAKTISRNFDWKNDFTLITTDVKNSPNSAKINNAVGGVLLDANTQEKDPSKIEANLSRAKKHLLKAIELHPMYFDAYMLLGNAYFLSKEYGLAILRYEFILKYLPHDEEAFKNLHLSYREKGRQSGMVENDPVKALEYLNKAYSMNSDDQETISLLGVAYGVLKDYNKALEFFNKVLIKNPKNAEAHFNVYLTYLNAGDQVNADKALKAAKAIDPDILNKFNAHSK
ncbi:MAG: glycosyltransferase family 39 protein [Saprospiraceae bacterium]|nr:glycosyltransferase family 39 protein [Candidatus Vicinibacter affinis]